LDAAWFGVPSKYLLSTATDRSVHSRNTVKMADAFPKIQPFRLCIREAFFSVHEGRAGISILRTGESTYFEREREKNKRTTVCFSRQFLALYCRNIELTLPHSVANPLYTVCYVTRLLRACTLLDPSNTVNAVSVSRRIKTFPCPTFRNFKDHCQESHPQDLVIK